ncbi:MAG TPA: Hsp20/alpha crystallin family protein [Desulfonatronum sp.]|nr:Hsp20/alpha crystallin family protein [Desulfonatronum sp.]
MLERLLPTFRQKDPNQTVPAKDVWDMLDTFMSSPLAMQSAFGKLTPAVDVSETPEAITVTAELPGMKPEEVDLHVENNFLVLRGHKKSETEEKKENFVHKECTYGSFSRSVPLPAEVQAEKVTAKYKNGVLTVHLPKSEKAMTKRISIEG